MLEFCIFLAILTVGVGGLADPEFDEDNENWILASRKTIMMKEVPKGANYSIQTYYNSWNMVYEEELAKKDVAREAVPFLQSEFPRLNISPEIELLFYVGIRDCGDNMTKMSNFREHEAHHFHDYEQRATVVMAVDYCGTPTVMNWCDMGRRLKAYMNATTTLPGTEVPVYAKITITCPSTFLTSLSLLFHTNAQGPNGGVPHFTWLFYVTFGVFLVVLTFCSGCIFVSAQPSYFMHILHWGAELTRNYFIRCSSLVGLLLTVIRCLAIRSQNPTVSNRLISARFGKQAVLATFLICFPMSILEKTTRNLIIFGYARTDTRICPKLIWSPVYTFWRPINRGIDKDNYASIVSLFDGAIFELIPSILTVIFTVLLVVELQKARRRGLSLGSEAVQTTKINILVLLLAIQFVIIRVFLMFAFFIEAQRYTIDAFSKMYRQYHENKKANYYRYRYMIPPPMPKKKSQNSSQAGPTVEIEMNEVPKRK